MRPVVCLAMRRRPSPTVLCTLLAAVAIAGCGKTEAGSVAGGGPLRRLTPVEAQGAISVTTRNTTRVGGADTTVDAASVARVVYPGLTAGSRPQAVVVVNRRDWAAALSASSLTGAPLGAPILYADGEQLPEVSRAALEAMRPTGAAALGGATVIRIGTDAPLPAPYSRHVLEVPAGAPAEMAAEIASVLARAQGARPQQAIVLDVDAPEALQMPAAGLAGESAAPILLTEGGGLPAATGAALRTLRHPSVYVMNPTLMSAGALGALARLGRVTQIPGPGHGEEQGAAQNAIAVARFTDGFFGWGVKEPGHGLVFANAGRPLDAPAAALLSATGEYAPMLLLQAPGRIPPGLNAYLGDIQPAYSSSPEFRPVKGVYNHGWLIGDERAISLVTQAELDSLLEISSRKQSSAEEASALTPE